MCERYVWKVCVEGMCRKENVPGSEFLIYDEDVNDFQKRTSAITDLLNRDH